MSKTFFITTAIDYPNGAPHIGHAYEKVLTDVIARYRRLRGDTVYFLTGVDQHGQKMLQTAEKEGVNVATLAKRNTKKFLNLWDKLDLAFDGWAETTSDLHIQCVQRILTDLHDQGLIQLGPRSRHDAADVMQDVFVVAAERLGQLRDPARLKPWLFAILRNEVYRRTGRKRRSVATRALDLERMPDVRTLMRAAADGITAEDWSPRPNPRCDRCPVRLVCPAWPEGREAYRT